MKKKLGILMLLVLLIFGAIAANVFAPEFDHSLAISDKVTAPDPNWLNPEDLQKGQEALQQLLNQK